MKVRIQIAALCIFVLGAVVMPIIHRVELALQAGKTACDSGCGHEDKEQPAGHDHNRCQICKLSKTPLDTDSYVVTPLTVESVVDMPVRFIIAPFCKVEHSLPFACGPPA